jgi:hypothetical protein
MEVTLYLPYYDYNDGAFDVNGEYYNENEYIDAISNEYNKNKDIVFNSMLDYNNGSRNVFTGADGQTYKFGSKAYQNEDKVTYASCEGILYNEDGEKDNVDLLIEHFAKQESFIEMIEFNMDTPEEEFETELSLWTREHSKINSYKAAQGEEWAWVNEPQRNVKVAFKNKANDTVYAVLENCKIMDIVDRNMYIVFVEKISLIDRI